MFPEPKAQGRRAHQQTAQLSPLFPGLRGSRHTHGCVLTVPSELTSSPDPLAGLTCRSVRTCSHLVHLFCFKVACPILGSPPETRTRPPHTADLLQASTPVPSWSIGDQTGWRCSGGPSPRCSKYKAGSVHWRFSISADFSWTHTNLWALTHLEWGGAQAPACSRASQAILGAAGLRTMAPGGPVLPGDYNFYNYTPVPSALK